LRLEDFQNSPSFLQTMRSVKAGRIVHAFLFSGPEGTGKKTAAKLLSQAVLCENEVKPCLTCPACRQIEAQAHPDVMIVAPNEKGTITVDAVRETIHNLSLKSYEGAGRVVQIHSADRMTQSAQNALLKTLETPPEGTVFVLVTDSPTMLLQTIHSRLTRVNFSTLSPEACEKALSDGGMDEDKARKLSAVSRGSVGRALAINENEDYFPVREQVVGALVSIKSPADIPAALLKIPDEKDDKQKRAIQLETMELWGRDLLAISVGQKPYQFFEIDRLRACSFSGKRLMQGVLRLRRLLEANVSWTNALTDAFYMLFPDQPR